MKKYARIILFVLIIPSMALMMGCGGRKQLFGLRVQEGDSRLLSINSSISFAMDIMSMINLSVTSGSDLDYKIVFDSVSPDGTIDTTITYEKCDIRMNLSASGAMLDAMGGGSEISEVNTAFTQAAQGAKIAEGKSFNGRFYTDGRVQVQGLDAIKSAIMSDLAGKLNMEQLITARQLIDDLFEPASMERILSTHFTIMPPPEVRKVGDWWKQRYDLDIAEVDIAYTFRDMSNNVLYLDSNLTLVDGSLDMLGEGLGDIQQMGGSISFTGSGSGLLEIDANTGIILTGRDGIDGKMSMTIPGAGNMDAANIRMSRSYQTR